MTTNAGHRIIRPGLAIAAVAAVMLTAASPAGGSTARSSSTGSTEIGSYEISSSRIDVDGSGECFDAEMDLDIETSRPDVYWDVSFSVGPAGAVPVNKGFGSGEGTTASVVTYVYCPVEFRPTNVVTGSIDFSYYGDDETIERSSDFRFEVSVSRAPTQTSISKVVRDQFGFQSVTGKVTTESAKFGRVGAVGTIYLMVKGKRNKWTRVGEGYVTGGLGSFEVYPAKPVKSKRATFRVDFVGTDWTAPSKSRPKTG